MASITKPERVGWLPVLGVMLALGGLVAIRLSAFGIFDPWELTAADAARQMVTGADVELAAPPLGRWLAGVGFALFGTTEWGGRLPIALMGLLALGAVYALVARFAGWRAGAYAAVVAATTPLFLLNARQMLGLAPAFFAETMVGLCAAAAVFGPTSARRPHWATAAWLAGAAASAALAVLTSGVLLGVLPPLAAVAVAAGLAGALGAPSARRSAAAWTVTAGALFVALVVVQEVAADAAGYSHWLGGSPRGGEPPPFGRVLEDVFHAFAPWSALALVALGGMVAGGGARPSREVHLRRVVVLWAAFGYGALTVYLSRYGTAAFTAVAPLAAACALLLRDVERSRVAWWPAAVVTSLLLVLLVRDFRLYPASPLAGLPVEGIDVPEVFNPGTAWSATFAVFGIAVLLSFGASEDLTLQRAMAPFRRFARRAATEPALKRRTGIAGAATLALLGLGVTAWLAPASLGVSVLARKVIMGLAFLIFPGVPAVVVVAQGARILVAKLRRYRALPVLLAALIAGGYVSHGFLPALSAHYSPRHIYDVYNELAAEDEPLGEYQVGRRAAAYYARGEVQELSNQKALLQFLTEGDERRWAVLPAEGLPALNRQYRRETGEHLYVADASSGRVVLAASRAVPGHPNENFLAEVILDAPRQVDHPVGAIYDEKVELIGYDLDLPHGNHVGAGESFVVRWHWRVLARVPGAWKIFVHMERGASRLNGDHEPVDGKYPVRMWQSGDIIVDAQELTVPAHFAPGDYPIFVGFWAGSKRLEVVEGPQDGDDRVRAGVLRVR